MVVVWWSIYVSGGGKFDGEYPYKFEGSLIAMRSDSLQFYTGGNLYMEERAYHVWGWGGEEGVGVGGEGVAR